MKAEVHNIMAEAKRSAVPPQAGRARFAEERRKRMEGEAFRFIWKRNLKSDSDAPAWRNGIRASLRS